MLVCTCIDDHFPSPSPSSPSPPPPLPIPLPSAQLLTASADCHSGLWDVEAKAAVKLFAGHTGEVLRWVSSGTGAGTSCFMHASVRRCVADQCRGNVKLGAALNDINISLYPPPSPLPPSLSLHPQPSLLTPPSTPLPPPSPSSPLPSLQHCSQPGQPLQYVCHLCECSVCVGALYPWLWAVVCGGVRVTSLT